MTERSEFQKEETTRSTIKSHHLGTESSACPASLRGSRVRKRRAGPQQHSLTTTAATAHLMWLSFSGAPEIFFSGSSSPSEVSSSADMAAALTPLVLRRHRSRGCGAHGSHSPGACQFCSPLSDTTRRRHRPQGCFHKNKALPSQGLDLH